ncbi:hypothetical protein JMUB6875_04620 [Nocardia sp. JMUB6875]
MRLGRAAVHPDILRRNPVRLDFRDHLVGEIGGVRMIDAHSDALCGKGFRDRATDTGGGAGDRGGYSYQ